MCLLFTNFVYLPLNRGPKVRNLKISVLIGSVAERSEALVLCSSHFDGVGSNPTAANCVFV